MVMRAAGDGPQGVRLRSLIVVLGVSSSGAPAAKTSSRSRC